MADPIIIAKAAATLADEDSRKAVGWIVAAILSPVIVVIALLCSLGTGSANQNVSIARLCFSDSAIPDGIPDEYRAYIEDMRVSFGLLDEAIEEVNGMMEEDDSLDGIRVKAIFYALFFGTEVPDDFPYTQFVDCFISYEDGTAALDDLAEIYDNLTVLLDLEITEEQKSNAESVYNLIRYGYAGGDEAGLPFIGVNGFCSPVGGNWRNIVTSEFGYRSDPFTGERKGHSGMDLAVVTGTPVRAALSGTVTVSAYNAGGYGYYVMIDHGGGLSTLYGHCSQLLVSVGQEVQVGDIVALSGSTGRSTGPHLHFEVRVNGERTDPRLYLP